MAENENPGIADPDETPKRKRKKKRLPKIVTKAQAERVIEAAGRQTPAWRGQRDRLILEFMYRAGLRVSEAVSVKPYQIEMSTGVIHLYDAKGGDGTAYFDSEALGPLLVPYLALRDARGLGDNDPLFFDPRYGTVSTRYVQRLVHRLKAECGIVGIMTPHVFRHTFATEMLEEGFSLTEVQSSLRHANLATTAVYLHVRDETLRNKHQNRRRGGESS